MPYGCVARVVKICIYRIFIWRLVLAFMTRRNLIYTKYIFIRIWNGTPKPSKIVKPHTKIHMSLGYPIMLRLRMCWHNDFTGGTSALNGVLEN